MSSRSLLRSLLPLALLLPSVVFLAGLDQCLGLCDYETDPTCEDPTRAQVSGKVSIPGAGGASVGFTPISKLDVDTQAKLRDAWRRVDRSAARAQPTHAAAPVPDKGARHGALPPTHPQRFRPSEAVVRAVDPVRKDKPAFARELELFLDDALQRAHGIRHGAAIDSDALTDVHVDVRLCGTETRCLADVRRQSGKALSLEETSEVVALLEGAPFLRYAEKNLILESLLEPNDEFYTLQWHYAAIDMSAAWDITTGSPDVIAAVVDTGVLVDHPDLRDRVTSYSADLIDDPDVANDGDGRDDDGNDDGDDAAGSGKHSYHGSHVAGTMGASTDNGTDVAGITWDGQILPVRVLGKGGGSLADIADGIEWAAGNSVDGVADNPTPVQVINMSLGGQGESRAMNDAVQDAVDAGVIVVVAAGNDDIDATNFTPANCPASITVASVGNIGSTHDRPTKASYSNFGDKVDVAAPGGEQVEDEDGDGQGDGVLSTWDDTVIYYQGTSMASPHVAGIAMLLKSIDPSLTQEDVREILKDSADPDIVCPEGCGAGKVSAAGALLAATGGLDGPRVVSSPSFVRVGLGRFDTPLAWKNLGNAATDVSLEVGGANRDLCQVSTASGSVGSRDTFATTLSIARNDAGDDHGECTVTATFDGGAAETRVVWTPDVIAGFQTVEVGAARIFESGDITIQRLVTTSELTDFDYKLFNLDAGTYLIVGVADINTNGSYDDDEDGIGIFFPPAPEGDACTSISCGRISVEAGDHLDGADFLVAPGFSGDDGNTGGTGDGALGDPCAASSECGGGLYCDTDLPSGYCTTDCFSDDDCTSLGGVCFPLSTADATYQVCLKSCETDGDCARAGYICDGDLTCYPG